MFLLVRHTLRFTSIVYTRLPEPTADLSWFVPSATKKRGTGTRRRSSHPRQRTCPSASGACATRRSKTTDRPRRRPRLANANSLRLLGHLGCRPVPAAASRLLAVTLRQVPVHRQERRVLLHIITSNCFGDAR
jgi:hypothetical protein